MMHVWFKRIYPLLILFVAAGIGLEAFTAKQSPSTLSLLNSALVLGLAAAGGRKLWEVSEDIKGLPTRSELETMRTELQQVRMDLDDQLGKALSKVGSKTMGALTEMEERVTGQFHRVDTELIALNARIADDMRQLRERFAEDFRHVNERIDELYRHKPHDRREKPR
jgi:hypothetical protein